MCSIPVANPGKLETLLFDAGLVFQIAQTEMYDIVARNFVQRAWHSPEAASHRLDVRDPSGWYDKLHACVGGEFFVHALEGCQRVLDVGCGEGWPSLYLAQRPCKPSRDERRKACTEIVQAIEVGALDVVAKVLYGGETRYPTADELPETLREAGFTDVCSRALPDAVAFARNLQQSGILARLQQADLIPYLHALVVGAIALPGWANAWVTCSRT